MLEKLKDIQTESSQQVINSILDFRNHLVKEVRENPKVLAKNLYEEQGEMRFGAENRIFVVLVDKKDYDNSWKLKRNLNLLNPKIQEYLDTFSHKPKAELELRFYKKGNPSKYPREYRVLTDVLLIEK
ncbi:MAG: hypothetical protein D6730_25290 [Bacteroidetes bacterium]|nr:MAG: hypothetical protein D6730_25290 [Bacteroidota bacterium]